MEITGIEVIRGENPRRYGLPRDDVERLMSHLNVSQETAEEMLRWHSVEELLPARGSGLASPAGQVTGVPAGESLELTYGDKIRINTRMGYRGPSQSVRLYGSVGERKVIIGFDEMINGENWITLPESRYDFTTVDASLELPISSDIDAGTDYDIYCKIREYSVAGQPEIDDVIDIVGLKPTFELLQETIYHFAWIYDGEVEVTTAEFTTDPFTPSSWLGNQFANKLQEEVRSRGGRPLEVRVYVDKTPLLWTDFRIEVISTPIGGATAASPGLAIPIWATVLIICLAITAVIVAVTLAVTTIVGVFDHKPDLEDAKQAWDKEALILDIQDAEEYWERTPTPVETLEEMSEDELRDHLDQIAEEEIPEGEGIGMGVALIGAAVLGVGGLALLGMAMSRPREARK